MEIYIIEYAVMVTIDRLSRFNIGAVFDKELIENVITEDIKKHPDRERWSYFVDSVKVFEG